MRAGPCKETAGPCRGRLFIQMTLGPYPQIPFAKRLQGPAVTYRTAVIMEDGRQGPGVRTGRLGTLIIAVYVSAMIQRTAISTLR